MMQLDIIPGTIIYGFSLKELKPIEAFVQTVKIDYVFSGTDYIFKYYDKDGKFITSQGYYDKSFMNNSERWFTNKYIRDHWLSEEINTIRTVVDTK